jgi:transcriptional regulator with XRE-family HTH domain
MPRQQTLGAIVKEARAAHGLTLRDVERATGIKSGHLSQIETERIAQPEMAMLWDLARLYELDFATLLRAAGLSGAGETSGRKRQRMTVALRALDELTPREQAEALAYMAEIRSRRGRG